MAIKSSMQLFCQAYGDLGHLGCEVGVGIMSAPPYTDDDEENINLLMFPLQDSNNFTVSPMLTSVVLDGSSTE